MARSAPVGLTAVRAAVATVQQAVALAGTHGLGRADPLERHLRDVLCGRAHGLGEDAVLTRTGRAAPESPAAAGGRPAARPSGGVEAG